MVEIPLITAPSQSFQIILDEQECAFKVYLRNQRLYMDMDVDGVRVFTGAVCLDGANSIQVAQAAFKGSLHFVDTQGRTAPQWEGLGQRWRLAFVSAGEELPERLRY